MKKRYSNGEVTVIWQPDLCIHSGICAIGLPEVFQPNERPWVKIDAASTDALIKQVKKCPSGALQIEIAGEADAPSGFVFRLEAIAGGPLMAYGDLEVKDDQGRIVLKSKATAFCRCGASENKPFCDGSHKAVNAKE